MPKYNVFVSHSHTDSRWARKLAKELSSEGLQVWLDEVSLSAGSSLTKEIEKALRDSETIVVLIDEDNVKSPNLFYELGYAVAMGKKIIPVVLGDVNPSDLPFDLRQFRYYKKPSPERVASQLLAQKK